MSKTLNQITQELVTTNMTLALNEGEISSMLENELLTLENELAEKADHYVIRMQKLDMAAQFWMGKAKEARDVAKGIENHIENMKDRIKSTMVQLQTDELLGESYKFKIRPSKPKVVITDEERIPNEYKVLEQKLVVSKDTVRLAFENGKTEIPGVEMEQGQTLNIGINK